VGAERRFITGDADHSSAGDPPVGRIFAKPLPRRDRSMGWGFRVHATRTRDRAQRQRTRSRARLRHTRAVGEVSGMSFGKTNPREHSGARVRFTPSPGTPGRGRNATPCNASATRGFAKTNPLEHSGARERPTALLSPKAHGSAVGPPRDATTTPKCPKMSRNGAICLSSRSNPQNEPTGTFRNTDQLAADASFPSCFPLAGVLGTEDG
jgi:hypothetical protein